MNHDPLRQKITVEDLLRVKRAERPPREFWEAFDRELRAKQLAAIVARRPWWSAVPRALGRLTRLHLPLGATAVFAVTVLSLREFRDPASLHELELTAPVASSMETPAVARAEDFQLPALPTAPVTSASIMAAPPSTDVAAVSIPAADVSEEAFSVSVSDVTPGEIAQVISMAGAGSSAGESERTTPSAYSIARNLQAAQAEEGGLITGSGFEDRVLPARMSGEPLAQVRSPSSVRLARLLNSGLSETPTVTEVSYSAERSRQRIEERQLYERTSRFDVDGGGWLVKF